MPRPTRRDLLKLGAVAAGAGLIPASIQRALALPANRRTGSLQDVEHIVVLMQENRSFDHYFGHLSGVRGVNDRHPVLRANGMPVWAQARNDPAQGLVMPFRLQTQFTSAECVLDLDHSWHPTHAAINAGRNDQWPANKTDMTMGYYTREDIPYHYALADAFTICDHYFCSTPNQTHPNRFYLMTGTNDPAGTGGGPLLDNVDWVDRAFYKNVPAPFTWTTFPERLQDAGITWQVYQQGLSVTDHLEGNFGTNVLANFRQFVDAPEGSELHRRGMSKRTLDDLRQDVVGGRLPQVSWLLPPGAFSEHPRWTPGYGAAYMARVLDALTADPAVWSKTVLLVMYDENDGYFDHMPPPQPPTKVLPGLSTVSTEGEIHTRSTPADMGKFPPDDLPYGLGPRVGMIAISPWSKGGFVCSEVFDHTSVIRFIEQRFGVHEPNLTPWRRAICGDLTSAFDFSRPRHGSAELPDTRDMMAKVDASCRLPSPGVPVRSAAADIGMQEPGTRPARPLPYDLSVDEIAGPAGHLTLEFTSHGKAAACFYVYREGTDETPRRYTVGSGATLRDSWTLDGDGPHLLSVTGPNGFLRRFQRDQPMPVSVTARQDGVHGTLVLTVRNDTPLPIRLTLRDNAYGRPERVLSLAAGQEVPDVTKLAENGHWYDLSLLPDGHAGTETRLAGHVETGRSSITDPAATKPALPV
ncbi:MAG: phosphocholine-specific phospholipase C [Janthinobacterium lividum]